MKHAKGGLKENPVAVSIALLFCFRPTMQRGVLTVVANQVTDGLERHRLDSLGREPADFGEGKQHYRNSPACAPPSPKVLDSFI